MEVSSDKITMLDFLQTTIICLIVTLLCVKDASGSHCSVDSSDKVVISGGSVSVRCMADGAAILTEWKLNNGTSNDLILIYNRYFNETTTSLANGYFVVNPSSQQSTLYVNHTVLSNAGIYYCICVTVLPDYTTVKDNASANVIILDGEPWFNKTTAITNGMPVVFTCNIAFRGIANSYILIQDISGNNQKGRNDTGAINALNNFTLDYSITSDANVNQTYMCSITLRNVLSQTIYSKSLITSVEWAPVHNVTVSTDAYRCVTNGLCAQNQTIRCMAEGKPKPDGFQWTVSINESDYTVVNDGSDQFILHLTGLYKIQCAAFNTVMNIRYNASSAFFVTNVITFGPPVKSPTTVVTTFGPPVNSPTVSSAEASKIGLIVGLVVGLSFCSS